MKKISIALLLATTFMLAACDRGDDDNRINVNKEFYKLMNDQYYWYDKIPKVDPNAYPGPRELLEAIRYKPIDKWSYITTKAEQDAYYNQASYAGFGFGSGFDSEGRLMISFVYSNSPLKPLGIDRSWQIVTIDGQTPTKDNVSALLGANTVGVSKTFVFKSQQGITAEHTISKIQIAANSVIKDTVYTFGSTKVGYFVLHSFVNPTTAELTNVFSKFQAAGIAELIVDLRYNGGGIIDVSNYLANLIGGNKAGGGIYCTYFHNDKQASKNKNLNFKVEANTLNLNRAFFITTKNTASASELVINGLKPFMEVVQVGSSTHGKPVGMYSFSFKNEPTLDWVFVPICFSSKNANGDGDFFDGLPAQVEATDDITHTFGSINEASLNATLAQIGVTTPKCTPTHLTFTPLEAHGLWFEIGAR